MASFMHHCPHASGHLNQQLELIKAMSSLVRGTRQNALSENHSYAASCKREATQHHLSKLLPQAFNLPLGPHLPAS